MICSDLSVNLPSIQDRQKEVERKEELSDHSNAMFTGFAAGYHVVLMVMDHRGHDLPHFVLRCTTRLAEGRPVSEVALS